MCKIPVEIIRVDGGVTFEVAPAADFLSPVEDALQEQRELYEKLAAVQRRIAFDYGEVLYQQEVKIELIGTVEHVFPDGSVNVLVPDGFVNEGQQILRVNVPAQKLRLV